MCSSSAFGLSPAEQWNKTFGTADIDMGNSVEQTSDGGYIMTGYTRPGGDESIALLIKTDANGNELWNKTFNDFLGSSVQQTSDGGYILTGSGNAAIRLLKTDANGNMSWDKVFVELANSAGRSVRQTTDNGYIITGSVSNSQNIERNVTLIKTNSTGDVQWQETFGKSGNEDSRSVWQTSDGGYILTGNTNSYGNGLYDVWLIKTNDAGIEQWNKTFGETGNDLGYSVQETDDMGYIIAGVKSYQPSGEDVWLIKTDSAGNKIWDRTFGGTAQDRGYSVQQTRDGGYVVAGQTSSYGAGGADVWVIQTDPSGRELWNKTVGGDDSDSGRSVQQTRDGGYVIAGNTASYGAGGGDAWLIKLRSLYVYYSDEIGVFRAGAWYLDANNDRSWSAGDLTGYFGMSGDLPVAGDWNADGSHEIGVFRAGAWFLDSNNDRAWSTDDLTGHFGMSGDLPVAGDWNADGSHEIGVSRGGSMWYLDANGDRAWSTGDLIGTFGQTADKPVAGYWGLPIDSLYSVELRTIESSSPPPSSVDAEISDRSREWEYRQKPAKPVQPTRPERPLRPSAQSKL
ncbi:MAG: hypothetical protein MUO26_15425 [Methanotrichaceae archaeon]|nr:hypothetical protein [Methanotrichaceae archaeon]